MKLAIIGSRTCLPIDIESHLKNIPDTIDAEYERNLRNKKSVFIDSTNTRKAVHLTMVTTYGVRQNSHSGIIQSEVTLEDLFA